MMKIELSKLLTLIRHRDLAAARALILQHPDRFPLLVAMDGITQGQFHHEDVLGHSLSVAGAIDNTCRDQTLLAGLYHDCGKPRTRIAHPDGRITFYGHDEMGAGLVLEELAALGIDPESRREIALMVGLHMKAKRWSPEAQVSDKALKKFVDAAGRELGPLLMVMDADNRCHAPEHCQPELVPALRERIRTLYDRLPPKPVKLPVTGEQIMEVLGLSPGPEVGVYRRIAEHLLRMQPVYASDKLLNTLYWIKYNQKRPGHE